MTIQECYEKMGGDYAQVEKRLPSAALIQKFAAKFLDDASFSQLCAAMREGNRAEAFRCAHTLKGVCGNLSFRKLLTSVSQLTELLRPETDVICDEAILCMQEVERDYALTASAIREHLASNR